MRRKIQFACSPVGNERRAFSFLDFKEREFAAKASEFLNQFQIERFTELSYT